ncbi:hypothetical protein HS045_16205 [Planomonospora sp. ID82291]|nr:hypothetical protein [Planomonospora sp. ID82291]
MIHTDESFSAAAWLRWGDVDGDYSVIEQKGTHQSPFRLGSDPQRGLVFTFTSADTAEAAVEGVRSDVKPPVNEWFHLAGVYDAETKTVSLYLNGTLIKSEPISFKSWDANSKSTLGSIMRGDLDDVRVYQTPLTAEQLGNIMKPQSFDIGARAQTKSRVSAAQNVGQFKYDHMSLEQCESERDKRIGTSNSWDSGGGWDWLVPYAGCWSRHQQFAIYKEIKEYDKSCGCYKRKAEDIEEWLNFDTTVVMHSYLGNGNGTGITGGTGRNSRDIKVWTRVDNFKTQDTGFWGLLLGAGGTDPEDLKNTLKLKIEVKGGTTPCSVIESTVGNARDTRTGSMRMWLDRSDDDFIVRSQASKVSHCTIMPWVIYNNPTTPGHGDQQVAAAWGDANRVPENKLRETAPRVRCDSIGMGGAVNYYIGGCVFNGASRVYTMNTFNLSNGAVARHIQKALTNPQDTVPFKADGPKHIPGNWNASRSSPEGKPLERIYTNTNAYKNNVDAKDKVCEEFFDDRPRKKTGEIDKSRWEHCDEYPFASTRQGGGFDHPEYGKNNFSVYALTGSQNTSAGTDLNIFYGRYRVLNGNQFWVAIK